MELKAGFRELNRKDGLSLLRLLVDFIKGPFYSPTPMERDSL